MDLSYQIEDNKEILFNMLDMSVPEKLNDKDLPLIYDHMISHFTHDDKNITEREWNQSTRHYFHNICQAAHKINMINKVKDPLENQTLFEKIDTSHDKILDRGEFKAAGFFEDISL